MEETKRLDYVDVCKAIGILLVVLGHTYYGPKMLHNLIYSFHMPLFFILAGFTYSKSRNNVLGFWPFAKKKARELLVPYALFALANLIIQIIWKRFLLHEAVGFGYVADNLKGIFFCYSSKQYMPNCSPIWFLLCLFIADLLFFWLMRLKKNAALAATACLGICCFIGRYPYDYNSYPWKFPVFLMAVFLMYIGYELRRLVFEREIKKHAVAGLGCLIVMALSFAEVMLTDHSVEMNENRYGNIIIFLLTAIPIPASLLMLCRNIPALGHCKPLIWLGRNTIYVVGFNYLCRDLAAEIYYLIPFLRARKISYLPLFLITAFLCLLCIWICRYAVRRYKEALRRCSV